MAAALVVAHHDEDLGWLRRVRAGYAPFVVSKTSPEAHVLQGVNRGYEASAYLEYIVVQYERLPEYVVFVHGHETSWHHAGTMDALVNGLHFRSPYRNINQFSTTAAGHEGHALTYVPVAPYRRRLLADHGIEPYGDLALVRPCAMFYVHRDLIRRHPRSTYCRLLETSLAPGATKDDAITFEYSWFKLFTGQDCELAWDRAHGQAPW